MSIRTGFFDLLTETLGTDVSDRIHPMVLPQGGCYPAVTYQQVSGNSEQHLQGRSALRFARFQVDIWSPRYLQALEVAHTLRVALDGYRGMAGTDYEITHGELSLDRDTYEEGIEAFRFQQDYELTYRRHIA